MNTENTTEQMTDEQQVEHQIAIRDEAGALSVVERSAALVVCDQASKERSVEIEVDAKEQRRRDLEEVFEDFVGGRHKAWKKAVATRDARLLKYDTVIKDEGSKRATWGETERVRLAKEAEERAAQEAIERAERVAEAQKKLDEAIGASSDSQAIIDIITLTLKEDDMTVDEASVYRARITALEAELAGATQEAAEAAAQAEMAQSAPPPPPAMAPPKTKGEVKGWKYTVTVTNMRELCRAIGEGKVAIAAVKPADGKLNSYAKDGMIKHGQFGCTVTKTPTSHTRP